jgi:APA family basic amino acid/polyamine antiporter
MAHAHRPAQEPSGEETQPGLIGAVTRVKPMDDILRQADENESGLQRSMGALSLTAFGVAAIIGAGIFVLTGQAAAKYAGPGIVISYVLAGIACALAAICYAELASSVPISGSAYTYAYAVLGELLAWIIGWDLILEYGVGAAAVGVGWSGYLTDFLKSSFGWTLPSAIVASPFDTPSGIVNLPALVILLIITAMLVFGTRQSSIINNVMVGIKLAIILFFIVVGATHIHTANWHTVLPFGFSGVLTGASIIFFAFIGFDQISTAAEEVRDPQRTMPRGILASLVICTLLYVLVSGILTGVVPYTKLNNSSPVSHAMLQIGLNWAATVISVGAVIGLTTVLLVLVFGQSRIFFAMARDRLLPGAFSTVHPRFHTPWLSTLIVGLCVALLAGFTPISVLAEMTNIGTLAAFIIVALAVWRLRYTQPDLPRGFRVPWVPVLPIASVLASCVLIAYLPWVTILRFAIWLIIGLAVYFLYSRHHSRVQAVS